MLYNYELYVPFLVATDVLCDAKQAKDCNRQLGNSNLLDRTKQIGGFFVDEILHQC